MLLKFEADGCETLRFVGSTLCLPHKHLQNKVTENILSVSVYNKANKLSFNSAFAFPHPVCRRSLSPCGAPSFVSHVCAERCEYHLAAVVAQHAMNNYHAGWNGVCSCECVCVCACLCVSGVCGVLCLLFVCLLSVAQAFFSCCAERCCDIHRAPPCRTPHAIRLQAGLVCVHVCVCVFACVLRVCVCALCVCVCVLRGVLCLLFVCLLFCCAGVLLMLRRALL